MSSFRQAIVATLLLFTLRALAPAQTTFATITGTATDSSAAVVPDVTVVAEHLATGVKTTTKSNEDGVFTIAQLRDGVYVLRATKAGFKEALIQDVNLVGRDLRRIDIVLQVGTVDTVVEVKGGATLIETETARISDTRDVAQLRDMPLNSRAIWAQLALVPNVLLRNDRGKRLNDPLCRQPHQSISLEPRRHDDERRRVRNADRAAG